MRQGNIGREKGQTACQSLLIGSFPGSVQDHFSSRGCSGCHGVRRMEESDLFIMTF